MPDVKDKALDLLAGKYEEPYLDVAKKGIRYISPKRKKFPDIEQLKDRSGKPTGTAVVRNIRYQMIPTEVKAKAKPFHFLDTDETYVQDNGREMEQINLLIYFIGERHHLDAKEFESALSERGPGILQLPLDDDLSDDMDPVRWVQVLSYKRTNRFVEAANRTTFEVKFHKTILDPNRHILTDKNTIPPLFAAQQDFAKGLNKLNPSDTKAAFASAVASVKDNLSTASVAVNKVKNKFESVLTSVEGGITDIFSKPLIIASQVQTLLNTPRFSQATDLISSYKNIVESVSSAPEQLLGGVSNIFRIQAMFGSSAAMVLARKATEMNYESRQQAVDTFAEVKKVYTDFIGYIEEQEAATASMPMEQRFTMDPELYEGLYHYLQRTTSNVDSLLSGLRKEATFVAEQDMTTINIAAEYYPTLFAKDMHAALDLVERINSFGRYHTMLVPKGTTYKVLI